VSDTAGSFPMLTEGDLHAHLRARMAQRGVTLEEIPAHPQKRLAGNRLSPRYSGAGVGFLLPSRVGRTNLR